MKRQNHFSKSLTFKLLSLSLILFISLIIFAEILCAINLKTFNIRLVKNSSSFHHPSESVGKIEKIVSELSIPSFYQSKFLFENQPSEGNYDFELKTTHVPKHDIADFKYYQVEYYFKSNGKKFFSFDKLTDDLNRRFVKNQNSKNMKPCFLLAFGDSSTYGLVVDQNKNYPEILNNLNKTPCQIYNYGINGESANDFYKRLSVNTHGLSRVKENEGHFVWLYINTHLERVVFPANAYEKLSYIEKKAEYTLEGESLLDHGFFSDKKSLKRKIISILSSSSIVKTFNLEIPRLYTLNHYQLFFTLLDYGIGLLEKENKKIDKRYIVLFQKPINENLFLEAAKKLQFEPLPFYQVLDQRIKNQSYNKELYSIPFDGHPTSEVYYLLAQYLSMYLSSEVRL